MEHRGLGDYIDIAIQREEEAHAFSTDLPAGVLDENAKDALRLLANEEMKYKEKVEYLCVNAAFTQMIIDFGFEIADFGLKRDKT
jgi:rubrerythrin